jgi:hypothetical protein
LIACPKVSTEAALSEHSISLLFNTFINQAMDLMSISSKYIVLGSGEVRVHLSWKECIFRNIGPPRVFIERQYEKPRDPDYNAEGGEIRWDLEDAGIFAERQDRSFTC